MVVEVRHEFVNAIPDDPVAEAAGETLPSHWNQDHVVEGAALAVHTHAGEDIASGTVADARVAGTLARDSEVTTAVSTHAGAVDPHPGYATDAEAATAASSAVSTHAAAGNPHPTYTTDAEATTIADAQAGAAVATHAGAADPHPGYTTAAEVATAISGKADTASAVMDGDAAGGDLSGTYPNPSVVDDSHSHGAGTAPGAGGAQDIEEVLTEGNDAGGQEITNLRKVTIDVSSDVAFNSAHDVITPPAADLATGGANAYVLRAIASDKVGTPDYWFQLDAYGYWSIVGPNLPTPGQGGFDIFDSTNQIMLGVRTDGSINIGNGAARIEKNVALDRFRIYGPQVFLGNLTPPADGDLAAGNFAIYFDDTDGAASPMWKGKSDDGTVVAGSLGGLSGSPQTYTESNVTTDRAFNANSTTLDEIADVLGTLIADLRSRGVVA